MTRIFLSSILFCTIWGCGFFLSPVVKAGEDLNDEFKERRRKVQEKIAKSGILVIRSGDSRGWNFRQDRDFYYLSGCKEAQSILVLSNTPMRLFDEGRRISTKSILYLRESNEFNERWNGKMLGTYGALETLGFDQAFDIEKFDTHLPSLLRGKDTLYCKWRQNAPGKIMGPGAQFIKNLRDANYRITPLLASTLIHPLRLIKSPSELEKLQRAINITLAAHDAARERIKSGLFEYQVEATIEYTFRDRGATGPGFSSIVGAGANGTVLHYTRNDKKIARGDLVLMDIGAEFDLYTADLTRTVPASGKFSDAQKEVYNLVLNAQEHIAKTAKPGMTIRELNAEVKKFFDKQKPGWSRFYMHGIGHHLGLDVHDPGAGYKPQLQPGMVFTIEPGIYISAGDSSVDNKYWDIGIRIEDDYLMTKKGAKCLSCNSVKTVDEIEKK